MQKNTFSLNVLEDVDEEILGRLERMHIDKRQARKFISSNQHNTITTTYYLLLKQKLLAGGSITTGQNETRSISPTIGQPQKVLRLIPQENRSHTQEVKNPIANQLAAIQGPGVPKSVIVSTQGQPGSIASIQSQSPRYSQPPVTQQNSDSAIYTPNVPAYAQAQVQMLGHPAFSQLTYPSNPNQKPIQEIQQPTKPGPLYTGLPVSPAQIDTSMHGRSNTGQAKEMRAIAPNPRSMMVKYKIDKTINEDTKRTVKLSGRAVNDDPLELKELNHKNSGKVLTNIRVQSLGNSKHSRDVPDLVDYAQLCRPTPNPVVKEIDVINLAKHQTNTQETASSGNLKQSNIVGSLRELKGSSSGNVSASAATSKPTAKMNNIYSNLKKLSTGKTAVTSISTSTSRKGLGQKKSSSVSRERISFKRSFDQTLERSSGTSRKVSNPSFISTSGEDLSSKEKRDRKHPQRHTLGSTHANAKPQEMPQLAQDAANAANAANAAAAVVRKSKNPIPLDMITDHNPKDTFRELVNHFKAQKVPTTIKDHFKCQVTPGPSLSFVIELVEVSSIAGVYAFEIEPVEKSRSSSFLISAQKRIHAAVEHALAYVAPPK